MDWFVGAIFGGFVSWYLNRLFKRPKLDDNLEGLKNALLTLALMQARPDEIDNTKSYKELDGSKLPMMSGCDLTNACFSYIIDKDEFRKDPWYTRGMEDKIDAIERYIKKNLSTHKQVVKLFEDFAKSIKESI